MAARDLPAHVKAFLGLKPGHAATMEGVDTWADLIAAQPRVKPHRWAVFSIDYAAPRSAAAVTRDLKRAARA
jgi:hypothetical protein